MNNNNGNKRYTVEQRGLLRHRNENLNLFQVFRRKQLHYTKRAKLIVFTDLCWSGPQLSQFLKLTQ